MGLDNYNRAAVGGSGRIEFIKQEYVKTTLARMARIFPAFGIGGVINKKIRVQGKVYLKKFYDATC